MTTPPIDTKQRLLDTAERLFAMNGFHSTSLRTITREAQANLAAVNYHFGSKEALMEAVLERRLGPLNTAREERLRQVLDEAAGGERSPLCRDVLRAFVEPTLRFREADAGARYFLLLVGRSVAEADSTVRQSFLRQVKPIFLLFKNALQLALPELSETILLARLHFTIGALHHIMCMPLQTGIAPPELILNCDSAFMLELLLPYLTAGMEAP